MGTDTNEAMAATEALPLAGRAGFTALPPDQTGVRFTNTLAGARMAENSSLMSGSGVALGDVDGDGWCDVYLCSLEGTNRLYRNLGGWHFEDRTVPAGVGCAGDISRGAVLADLDGDGDLDLLVSGTGSGVRSFVNDGRGVFAESTREAGLESKSGATSMALADVEGDGDLDLYVANFPVNSVLRDGGSFKVSMVRGQPVITGRMAKRLRIVGGVLVELGEPDVFYLNDGRGRFTAAPWEDGLFLGEDGKPVAAPMDFGLSVVFRDLNGDLHPDLYVCNDFHTPDRIWINDGRGRFQVLGGVALPRTSLASMGADFADLDRDGRLDGMVVEMLARSAADRKRQMNADAVPLADLGDRPARRQVGRNTLLWNRGDGTYAEIAYYAGVAASDWSWMPAFMDVDLDGYEDLLIPNGISRDLMEMDGMMRSKTSDARLSGVRTDDYRVMNLRNCAFRNRGDLTFEDAGARWGFDSLAISSSLAMGDLDRDGDLDLVVNCLNAPALLCRNESAGARIAVRLASSAGNTHGIGAQIRVFAAPLPPQSQEVLAGGRYLGSDDTLRVFAVPSDQRLARVEITWRDGRQSVYPEVSPNTVLVADVREAAPAAPAAPAQPDPKEAWFEEVSDQVPYRHTPADHDELSRNPLLPRLLTRAGPGVAWVDLDGDAVEDLVVGTEGGQALGTFRNEGRGRFSPMTLPDAVLAESATGLVGPLGGAEGARLVVGLSAEATGQPRAVPVRFLGGQGELPVPAPSWPVAIAPGPLALADVDADGDLDLFVGGASVPGRFPEPSSSLLLLRDGSGWQVDRRSAELWRSLGRVRGAVFTDLDGDHRPDLVAACEWGPVRVLRNGVDGFAEATGAWQMEAMLGLWSGVAAGDFDGDGRMDLVAGNLGLNSAYQLVAPGPWFLDYGDLNGDGVLEVVEAFREAGTGQVMPWRQLGILERGMPWLRERYETHAAYSRATLDEVLGNPAGGRTRLTANWLATTLFLNRGDHFEPRLMPPEAQWAPVFGMSVADFDGDGREDLFLAQNDAAVRPDDVPLDSGRGLILRGDGEGNLSALPGDQSGVILYGTQRAAAAADFDGDGRVDLAVAENDGPLRLFRNTHASPGIRVRLRGPAGNPVALGARLRWIDSRGPRGAAREVHGGGGYWSQNAPTQVMKPPPGAVLQLEVIWPGGSRRTYPAPTGATMLELQLDPAELRRAASPP